MTFSPLLTFAPSMQVDERLNGDGAGIPFGVNDPALAWVIIGVFGTVWALYAASAKSFGAQEEEDGLSL
jgi:photosystem II PsbW protein